MKKLIYPITGGLISLVCLGYVLYRFDFNLTENFWFWAVAVAGPYIWSVVIWFNVYHTPDKSTEIYKVWQDELPSKDRISFRLFVTALAGLYSIFFPVIALKFDVPGLIGDWGGFQFLGIDFRWNALALIPLSFVFLGPLALIDNNWAKYLTIIELHDYFDELTTSLHGPTYCRRLLDNVPDPNPDTKMCGSLAKADMDYLSIALWVDTLVVQYKLDMTGCYLDGCSSLFSRYRNAFQRYNKNRSRENGDELFESSVAFGKQFCKEVKVLGGVAKWIRTMKTLQKGAESSKDIITGSLEDAASEKMKGLR